MSSFGIGTYADFEEVQRGEEITLALMKAIEESIISAIVFSDEYAFFIMAFGRSPQDTGMQAYQGTVCGHLDAGQAYRRKRSFGQSMENHEGPTQLQEGSEKQSFHVVAGKEDERRRAIYKL
ncbi:uncharacterized protein LOC110426009 [Herrania umbratica]|uniref:Uncharacterized protein LOC110426009 n=1 Tax=Herrania umbratica TaxID=108875 RepID=A0A6J1BBZ7_9ROSI|nr:uncharacterized protein LOC110426009 [Herrania umbratica]